MSVKDDGLSQLMTIEASASASSKLYTFLQDGLLTLYVFNNINESFLLLRDVMSVKDEGLSQSMTTGASASASSSKSSRPSNAQLSRS